MASISETIQKVIDSITRIFRRKSTLATLSRDDLVKEKNTLERNENKILRQMQQLEKKKELLFEEAKQERSESVRRAKARQIRDIDQRIRSLQATLGPLGQRISVLDRFISMHDMGNFAPGSSEVMDLLRQADSKEIEKEIKDDLAAAMMEEEKMDAMTESFKVARERDEEQYTADEELMDILAEIEQAAIRDASVEEAALLKETPSSKEATATNQETPMTE